MEWRELYEEIRLAQDVDRKLQLAEILNKNFPKRQLDRMGKAGVGIPPEYWMKGGRIQRFQTGGHIPGYGGGDRVPAMLEKGEFIVRKEVAREYLPELKKMNQDGIVYASNGLDISDNNGYNSIFEQLSIGDGYDRRTGHGISGTDVGDVSGRSEYRQKDESYEAPVHILTPMDKGTHQKPIMGSRGIGLPRYAMSGKQILGLNTKEIEQLLQDYAFTHTIVGNRDEAEEGRQEWIKEKLSQLLAGQTTNDSGSLRSYMDGVELGEDGRIREVLPPELSPEQVVQQLLDDKKRNEEGLFTRYDSDVPKFYQVSSPFNKEERTALRTFGDFERNSSAIYKHKQLLSPDAIADVERLERDILGVASKTATIDNGVRVVRGDHGFAKRHKNNRGEIELNKVFTERGVVSTTYGEQISDIYGGGDIIHYTLPKGFHFIPVADADALGIHKEVAFPPNTSYILKSAKIIGQDNNNDNRYEIESNALKNNKQFLRNGGPVRYQHGGRVTPRYATGGKIPGYGGGDKIPALLEAGEYVVRKEVATRYTPFLESMNRGVRHYQSGGLVDPIYAAVGAEVREIVGRHVTNALA